MVWGGRRERGSGWGTRIYPWRIRVDVWQNQYNIVKLKKKRNKPTSVMAIYNKPTANVISMVKN